MPPKARTAPKSATARPTKCGSSSQQTTPRTGSGDKQPTPRTVELDRAEFFRALPPERFAQLRRSIVRRRFERGHALFFEGQPAAWLWAIRNGSVRQYKSSLDGRIGTLEVLGPGEIFGAVSAMEEGTYPASAEAISDGVAFCLPRERFLRLLVDSPELTHEVLDVVYRRLCAARERMRSLAHDSASARLAQALLAAARDGEARVTRRTLAETAGTSVETAIRVLRRFEKDELVAGQVGRVTLLDEEAIQSIARASRG